MASLKDFKRKNTNAPVVETEYIPYLSIGADKSTHVQFLAEPVDFDYSVEHVSPNDWRKAAQCTIEKGNCFPCEQQLRNWNQRPKVLIPVLHFGTLKVLSQGFGVNSLARTLAKDYTKNGKSIQNQLFVISRKGAGKRTKYEVQEVDNGEVIMYNGDISLQHMKKSMDYSDQANYYN